MGLISSVLIALRLGLINCSHSLEWANMHSRKLFCIISVGIFLAFFVSSILRGRGFLLGAMQGDRGHAGTCRGTHSLQRAWIAQP